MSLFRPLRTLLAPTIIAFGTLSARAEIVEAEDSIVDSRVHRQLTTLSEKLGTHDTVLGKGQAVAVISTAGCNFTLIAVGPIGGDAKAYARKIDTWRRKSGFGGNVEWSQEDDCAAAKFTFRPGRFGMTQATTKIDLAALRETLLALEPKSQFAASDASWSKIDYGFPAEAASAQGTRFWNLTDTRKELPTITGTIRLAPWMPGLMWAWFLIPIVGVLCSFAIGIVIAKNGRIPLARRRKLYGKAITFGTYGTLAVHGLLVAVTLPTRMLEPMAQLWFGVRFAQLAILVVPYFVIAPFLTLPWMNKIEKKLMGPTEEEALSLEPDPKIPRPLTPLKKGWMLRYHWIFWGTGVGIMVLSFLLPLPSEFRRVGHFAGVLVSVLPNFFAFRKMDLPKFIVEPETVEGLAEKLRERVAVLALKLEMEPPASRVLTEAIYGRFGTTLNKEGIGVAVGALEDLPTDELDFLIAQELTRSKLRYEAKQTRFIALSLSAVFVPSIIVIGWSLMAKASPFLIFFPFLSLFMILVPLKYFFGRFMLRQQIAADQLALEATGNRRAAWSALRISTLNSSNPGVQNLDMSAHPTIKSRLIALGEPILS